MNPTITAVAGLEAGHYTDLTHGTGCTVFICRQGAVGGVDVRGGSPGTRETDLLRPVHRVDRVHGLLLTGGSAFGLDAAGGVLDYLSGQGIGFTVGPAVVPIVPAAVLFDLGFLASDVRPTFADGRAASLAANVGPMDVGTVGAGTGATVAKINGIGFAVKSGIGSASMRLSDGTTIAAAVAVNAYGGVYDYKSGLLIAGPRSEDRYGRILFYVYNNDGESIDETLVREGLALAWTRDGQHKDGLVAAEEGAKRDGVGCLW